MRTLRTTPSRKDSRAPVRGRRSFNRTGALDAWIARCVLNAARDECRRPRFADDADRHVDAATTTGSSTIDDAIARAAVRRLPQLRFYLGFGYGAIAETLGIAVGTASATLHAARASLVANLQEVLT